jgi:uncharacterized Tic20 family protein
MRPWLRLLPASLSTAADSGEVMSSGDSSYDVEIVKLPTIKASVRDLAAFSHLIGAATFLGFPLLAPLVIWLTKRRSAPFAARHAKEALNFQINILSISVGAVLAGHYLAVWVPQAYSLALMVAAVVLVYGAFMAFYVGRIADQGKAYRYSAIIRLIP